jgi:hypothetical protein
LLESARALWYNQRTECAACPAVFHSGKATGTGGGRMRSWLVRIWASLLGLVQEPAVPTSRRDANRHRSRRDCAFPSSRASPPRTPRRPHRPGYVPAQRYPSRSIRLFSPTDGQRQRRYLLYRQRRQYRLRTLEKRRHFQRYGARERYPPRACSAFYFNPSFPVKPFAY